MKKMSDPGKIVQKHTAKDSEVVTSTSKVIAGLFFGFAFGFLLQKGGVGKFHILIGQLLLRDWTVVKIMLTAIIVGMVGVLSLHHFAKVNLHLKPTKLGSNIIGGLIFGAGFALMGYCPGTAAAALGQGSYDAIFGMLGLIIGSFMYAESSSFLNATVGKWGDLGKIQLYELFPIGKSAFTVLFLIVLSLVLMSVEFLARG